MESPKETQKKIQELQILEHQAQSFQSQKQTFQLDLNETINALNEVKKTEDSVYKILSGIMLKADKNELLNELKEKEKILDLRINSIEKQESLIEKKAHELKDEITSSMNENKQKIKK
jgi:prefoldin beta subunit